jgi:hypothetical protein
MPDLVGAANWAKYKDLIREATDTFAQKQVTWRRYSYGFDPNGEDLGDNGAFEEIDMRGLLAHNYYLKWPINLTTTSGELERMNTYLMFDKRYLQDNGWLSLQDNFNYGDKVRDRFIIDGIIYKAYGDTNLSQAKDEDLHFALILQRQETLTGDTEEVRTNDIGS